MNARSLLASWFAPLLIYGQNQQTALTRAATAKANGLDPNIYGLPMPGSTVTNTTTNTGGGLLKGALLSAGMLASGAAATVGGQKLVAPPTVNVPAIVATAPATLFPPAPTAPVATSPAPVAPATPAWDAIYEEQQPDGTWKQIKREHLTPGK
jgi:hypothetical protein